MLAEEAGQPLGLRISTPRPGLVGQELPGGLDAAASRQVQVHHHDVGPGVGDDVDGVLAVRCLTDDLDAVDLVEQDLQAAAVDRMVVAQNHLNVGRRRHVAPIGRA